MWPNLAQQFLHSCSHAPKELIVFLLGMLPVGEVRVALPMALMRYHMPIFEAYFLSVLGNIIPAILILWGASRFHVWVQKHSGFWGKHWVKYLAKIQNKLAKYQKYELLGLLIFIASSLPGTGAYTGAIAAFVFGIEFKKSWPYVVGGIMISGVVTLFVTVGLIKIF